MTASEQATPQPATRFSWLERAGYALLILLCFTGIALLLALPAESLITDLVYRAF